MKRLLLINQSFYGYNEKILKAFKSRFDADLFEIDFKETLPSKVLSRITGRKLYDGRRGKVLSRSFSDYDVVLVIVGRTVSPKVFESLKKNNPSASFVLYLWDDVKRVENFSETSRFFDRIFSFDRSDCEKYGFEFLPLFFLPEYRYGGEEKTYDFTFMGWNHSDRLEIISSLEKKTPGKKWFIRFLDSKRRIDSLKGKYPEEWFIEKDMTSEECAEVLKRSRCAVDIAHPTQRGLTMRSFEAIAAGCGLITTNPDVKSYGFYDERTVCVIDRLNPAIPESFSQIAPDGRRYDEYSLMNWTAKLTAMSEGKEE